MATGGNEANVESGKAATSVVSGESEDRKRRLRRMEVCVDGGLYGETEWG